MKTSTGQIVSLGVFIVCLLVALPAVVGATGNGEQLRRTMAEISLLNGQLAQRKVDATGIREELTDRLAAIKAETWRHGRSKNIQSESVALKNPRILYNLKLIAEIQAYIERYTQKIGYYRVACDRLSYLYLQADDDLKIVNTLSGMKIEALISQAEKILDAYLPDAQTLIIQPGTLTVDPPEKVWSTLISGR